MTFKKLHKRQIPVVGATTPAAATTTSSSTYVGHATQIQGTGPPLVLTTTTTSTSGTSSGTSSVTASGSSTTSRSSTSAIPTVPPSSATTRPTTSNTPATRTIRTTTGTTSSAISTPTNADSGGMGVGSMAGIAAAAIIGIGVITAFIVWFMRRRKRNQDIDEEPFNRSSFLRHSTAIPDDDAPMPSRVRPPPSMAERQPAYGGGQMYNDMGQNQFGYNTQPSYGAQPGQAFPHPYGPGGAPATPLPYSPGFGTAYDQQQGFNNGGYADLTRGAPNHEYPPSPRGYDQYENPHSPSYVGHDNFPVPPAAAGSNSHADTGNVHYPELTPATTSAQQAQVISVRDSAYNGRETPVQMGFAPGVPTNGQQHGRAPVRGARPETVYDTEDAYGGI